MRFVAVKTEEQQSVLMLHRTRQLFVRQRTMLINAIRAHMAEFGIVAGVGRNGVERLLRLIDEGSDERVPPVARECLQALRTQLVLVKQQILEADRRILAWHRSNELSRRLETIPGNVSAGQKCSTEKENRNVCQTDIEHRCLRRRNGHRGDVDASLGRSRLPSRLQGQIQNLYVLEVWPGH